MADWKDKYRKASFRGINFHVQSETATGGRELVAFKYPGRDDVEYEDMGAKAESIQVSAYVIKALSGESYDVIRDSLVKALGGTADPGILVLPMRKENILVHVSDYKVLENDRDGGIAVFDITFSPVRYDSVEVGAVGKRKPKVRTQKAPIENIREAKKGCWAQLKDEFEEKYVKKTKNLVNRVNVVNDILSGVADGIFEAKKIFTPVTEFKKAYETFKGKTVGIALAMLDFAAEFSKLTEWGFDVEYPSTPGSSSSAVLTLDNNVAVAAAIDTTATEDDVRAVNIAQAMGILVSCASVFQFIQFESKDQLLASRDSYFEVFDTLLESDIGEGSAQALQDLKQAVMAYLAEALDNLRSVKKFQLNETVPATTLADSLYGNLDLMDDLLARNKVENPMFVQGGVPLEARNA